MTAGVLRLADVAVGHWARSFHPAAWALAHQTGTGVGPWLANRLQQTRARMDRRIAWLQPSRQRLGEFVADHDAELSGARTPVVECPGRVGRASVDARRVSSSVADAMLPGAAARTLSTLAAIELSR